MPAAASAPCERLLDPWCSVVEGVAVEVMMGRTLVVPRAGEEERVCYFTFDELCNRPVGASDYIAMADRYHTLCLQGVPVVSHSNRHAAHRFVTLIDVLVRSWQESSSGGGGGGA